ncbi:MAG TPA: methyltransferase domain-containing protein [Bacteroidales bacterium]|nr:methyltransferase domain-containing protein [Bacteroidales bacterium]
MLNNNSYHSQDRGSESDYMKYLMAMDAVSVEKVASASAFFNPGEGNTIVDVGMASGLSSSILAHLFPRLNIIGVDINPKMAEIAAQTYRLPNLSFRVDDGEKLTTFEKGSVHGFFNCSSIHHITSFNGYDSGRALNTLRRQAELLAPGGMIVVRDFVKPPETEVILQVDNVAHDSRPSDAELLLRFSKEARSLAPSRERGFPLKELPSGNGLRQFRLFYADAVEFIRRKDYYENWDIELQEEYGYFTQKEFEDIFAALGLRTITSFPIYNPWIVRNRYRGKFSLFNLHFEPIGFPPTNYLIAGEKVDTGGTRLHLVRHLPEIEKPFLNFGSYIDRVSGNIFDVVRRPNSVVDFVPYRAENENIIILAKHGYPRPVATVETDSPTIDGKHYSGYMIEGLTASYSQPLEIILEERASIAPTHIETIDKSLEFFTSPGGIDEKVESVFVRIDRDPHGLHPLTHVSGFADSGTIRGYDAIQLLKTAQTGALVEARLELNIYNLLRKLNRTLPPWLGESIQVEEMDLPEITSLESLLAVNEQRFVPTFETAGYLRKYRAKFAESGGEGSANILEFVAPQHTSINTLVTLPVAKYKGDIFVGLECRHLPVPQIQSGNSFIVVAPACRLPKEIGSFFDLENHILSTALCGCSVKRFSRLGEKFYPSVGVTPEQVYPYVVSLSSVNNDLKWVSLKELHANLEQLRDGHLLICVARLVHALNG